MRGDRDPDRVQSLTTGQHSIRIKWAQFRRTVGLITLLSFALCSLTPLANVIGKFTVIPATIGTADSIVVLGAGILNDGSLADESMRRFMQGVSLYKRGLAPLIVMLGPTRKNGPTKSEAETRAELAHQLGIPKEALLAVGTANTTHQEAVVTANLLKHRDVKKILLVTESIHLRRAKLSFEREGLEVLPVASDAYFDTATDAQDRIWLIFRIAEETAALTYYRVAGYI